MDSHTPTEAQRSGTALPDLKPLAQFFGAAFSGTSAVPDEAIPPPRSRRRRRLWELPPAWHCPLLGTCLSIAELCRLAERTGMDAPDLTDYALHAQAVERSAAHSTFAETLQGFLDRRHAPTIRRFARASGGAAILALWRQALADGEAAAALWAAWTHPDTDEDTGTTIYGELHMLAHELGAAGNAVRRRLGALEQERVRLNDENATLHRHLAAARRERKRLDIALKGCLAEISRQAAQSRQAEAALAAAQENAAENATLRASNTALQQRLAHLEQCNARQADRIAELETQSARNRQHIPAGANKTEGESGDVASTAAAAPAISPGVASGPRLAGRRILCIGGRTGQIEHYRRMVEAGGGDFIHHDGGQEDNEHRLDAIVSGADVVLCQITHLSHAACWQIKAACKRHGRPCRFLTSGGTTSFARMLARLDEELPPLRPAPTA